MKREFFGKTLPVVRKKLFLFYLSCLFWLLQTPPTNRYYVFPCKTSEKFFAFWGKFGKKGRLYLESGFFLPQRHRGARIAEFCNNLAGHQRTMTSESVDLKRFLAVFRLNRPAFGRRGKSRTLSEEFTQVLKADLPKTIEGGRIVPATESRLVI